MLLRLYWALIGATLTMVIVILVVCWIASGLVVHPDRWVSPYTLRRFGLPQPELVHFETRDGVKLAGWFFRGSNGATVILAHGRSANRKRMLPHADYLHREGFSVFMFDFRYHGESEGDTSTFGAKEQWDVEGAVAYLKKRTDVDPERIGVQGNSVGAVAGILAAEELPEIKGLICEAPFNNLNGLLDYIIHDLIGAPTFPFTVLTKWFSELRMGVDFDQVAPDKIIGKISPRPIFLIDDLEDDLTPKDSVEVLYEAAREPKALWQIPDCPHDLGYECAPEEYERRVLAFWRDTPGKIQTDSPHKGNVIQGSRQESVN